MLATKTPRDNMKTVSITQTAYSAIAAAGMDVEVHKSYSTYIVHLLRDGQRIARAETPQTGKLQMAEVRRKITEGRWGRTSAMYNVLEQFAAIARAGVQA